MFRLLALALGIWGSSAFAFQATRISCTSQNAKLELVPMTVYFQTVGGRTLAVETPFHFWLVPNRGAANQIERTARDDDSPILVMNHAKLQWRVNDTRVDIDLERTLKGEAYITTNDGQAMIVSTAEKQLLTGLEGWMLSCSVIESL